MFNSKMNIYQPEEFINITKTWVENQEKLEEIKKYLSVILDDFYAFNQIAKNPPQPSFDSNYHNKVDIQKELSLIKTENRDIYSFYQDIRKIFSKVKDNQFYIDIGLDRKLNYVYLSAPVYFKPLKNNDEIIIRSSAMYLDSYENEKVYNIISENNLVPIQSINGKNPFDFITEFGNNYINLRSPHANFAVKSRFNELTPLISFPLSYEELSNLTFVYENGVNCTTNYLVFSGLELKEEQFKRSLLFKNNDINTEENNHFLDDNKKQNKLLQRNETGSNENIFNNHKKSSTFLFYTEWDYTYSTVFSCKADNKKEINVYSFNRFSDDVNIVDFGKTLEKCFILFDNNTYPIVLIGNLIGGTSVELNHILLEILSPLINSKIYAAFRKTKGAMKSENLMSSTFPNVEECEEHPLKDYFNKSKTINYGNGISDELSDVFLYDGKNIRKILDEYKLKLKNKRKPTDIVVIADGSSHSGASILLKYLQYYGGGITVGIYQQKNKKDVPFDSSLSPTPLLYHEELYKFSKEYRILNEKYNFKLQLAGLQTFYDPRKIDVPLEYEVTPVDETEDIYELLVGYDDDYYLYIETALKILEKYKTECNPNNKKLVNVSDECDKTFENNYTHGGYECGDDGKWSSKCVASYCDLGYYFDYVQRKCIIDYCSTLAINDSSNIEKHNKYLLVIIISSCALALIIAIIIIVVVIINNKKKNNESDYENIAKISLSTQDRTG